MLTHVLTPIRIAGCEIKNRVVRTAHATGLGAMNEDLIAYHRARAEGGVGLTILEILSVHPTSPASLNTFDPSLPDRYGALLEAVRPTGMKLFQQIWHAGQNGHPLDGSPPWSPSDLPGPTVGVPSQPMTKGMIDEIVAAYADAVAKCVAWGLDGAEIHCAHGYLPAQFLSTNVNKRDDDYGGPFENRVRFILEVMRAAKAAAPAGFALGVRLAPDFTAGGVGPDDCVRVARLLEGEGLIDFVDVSAGNYQSFPKMIGGMHEPTGYELPTSTPVTAAVQCPTIVTGRFRTLEEADQVIRAGEADLVGLTRAHIADPEIVRKTEAGRAEQVRSCIACNQGCVGNLLGPRHRISCAINPGAGFETRMGDERLKPAPSPKRVLVVGAGPSGLEAARVAALRGHQVILAEAEPDLGGALKLAARAPTRHGMGDFLAWLEAEVFRLGVDVRTSTYLDADDVTALAPDAVIIATGASPRMDGVQASNPGEPVLGVEQPHVISSHDLFSDRKRDWGRSAVVVDDAGHYEGVAAAEELVGRGLGVTYVTRHASFAPGVETALMTEPALQRLSRGAFAQRLRSRAVAITASSVVIVPTYLASDANQGEELAADVVVLISANRPNRELHAELAGRVPWLAIAGDANAPRYLETAVREGHIAGVRV
jgi:2,4-dienoyl-CoA reductase-like NADH-dependent reductase (Old Yellow Enzyme family)/pyruvate/2-oxoglutarate dehydrogenase complex dihydrolipoamide dehydrogenase (E3) component